MREDDIDSHSLDPPQPGPSPGPSGNWLNPCTGMSTTPGKYGSPSAGGVSGGMCIGNNILPAATASKFWNQKNSPLVDYLSK